MDATLVVVDSDADALALVLVFNWEGTLLRLANLVPQRYRLEGDEWRQMSPEQRQDFMDRYQRFRGGR